MKTDKSYSVVQCFPLLSYILALNVSSVDLLSLDVQGTETLILESLLNSNVSTRVIVAEDEHKAFNHMYMEAAGYLVLASHTDHIYLRKGDRLLARKNIKERVETLKGDKKYT